MTDPGDKKQCSSKGSQDQNIPADQTQKSGTMQQEQTGPIDELFSLMKKNPKIRIIINQSRLALQAPPEWQRRNDGLFTRISRLVYFDPVVFEFLHNHGSEIITCDNLMKGVTK